MGNIGLSGGFISDAGLSFKMVCLHLLEMAYCEVRNARIVTCEWDENAISEVLTSSINANSETMQYHITAFVEKRLLNGDLYSVPSSVDDAPRIDIMIGGFTSGPNVDRTQCYMEAKNLYCQDFVKSGNLSKTSSIAYAKRYIDTGIDNLLIGHYPEDTLLLGYVLNGTVQPAVDIINARLANCTRAGETISTAIRPEFPCLVLGLSNHPNGMAIDHCFLQF